MPSWPVDSPPLVSAQHTIQGEMAYAPVVCRLNDHYTENNINGRGACREGGRGCTVVCASTAEQVVSGCCQCCKMCQCSVNVLCTAVISLWNNLAAFCLLCKVPVPPSAYVYYYITIHMTGQFLSGHVAVKQVEGKTFRPRRSSSVTIRINMSIYKYCN